MNKQLYTQVGVTEEDFKQWCKDNKKPSYKKETKEEFFALIQDGRLIKDRSGKLVKRYKKD